MNPRFNGGKQQKTHEWSSLRLSLKQGEFVSDLQFDLIYPNTVRELSSEHWTPVEVAVRAARLLVLKSSDSILDVGSGCGKFCTIAALSTGANFLGVEQRPHLISIARDTARKLQAYNAKFVFGNMMELDWSVFDGFYFFNPFHENKYQSSKIDNTVSLSIEKFNKYLGAVVKKLDEAKINTRVVTYH